MLDFWLYAGKTVHSFSPFFMAHLTEKELTFHRQFAHYGRNAKEWLRKCALLLPHINRARIWEKKGFSCIYEYAAKLAGMSRNSVDDALRILRRIEDKPELKRVVAVKGLNAVRPVAGVATKETAGFWAEKALWMSKHTLETYVKDFLKQTREPTEKSRTGTENTPEKPHAKTIDAESFGPPKVPLAMQLEPAVAEQLLKLKGEGDWNTFMKQLLAMREAQLEAQKPLSAETSSRHIPVAIQKHVLARTNGQCAFPGCAKPHESLHHTQRWLLENIHDPDRIAPLCKAHERIAHLGLVDNEEVSPSVWRLRKEPDKALPKHGVDSLVAIYR